MVATVMSAPDSTAVVHPVQLVAAQDQQVVEIVIEKVVQVFADGVGGALVPRGVGEGLFRREDFHKAAGEMVELIGLREMLVQGGGVELRQDVNTPEAGVDAVGDRDVHEPVFAGQRHRRLGPLLGQRKKPGPLPSAHDDGKHVAGVN
jgi:hypothetical protein